MEHVVFCPGPDGAPGFHRFSSLEEALGFVEHKRNVEGVQDVAVCALTPVPVAFRAYYKVEVPDQVAAPAADALPGPVAVEPVDVGPVEAVPVEAVPVDTGLVDAGAANGKRSLGFFAH